MLAGSLASVPAPAWAGKDKLVVVKAAPATVTPVTGEAVLAITNSAGASLGEVAGASRCHEDDDATNPEFVARLTAVGQKFRARLEVAYATFSDPANDPYSGHQTSIDNMTFDTVTGLYRAAGADLRAKIGDLKASCAAGKYDPAAAYKSATEVSSQYRDTIGKLIQLAARFEDENFAKLADATRAALLDLTEEGGKVGADKPGTVGGFGGWAGAAAFDPSDMLVHIAVAIASVPPKRGRETIMRDLAQDERMSEVDFPGISDIVGAAKAEFSTRKELATWRQNLIKTYLVEDFGDATKDLGKLAKKAYWAGQVYVKTAPPVTCSLEPWTERVPLDPDQVAKLEKILTTDYYFQLTSAMTFDVQGHADVRKTMACDSDLTASKQALLEVDKIGLDQQLRLETASQLSLSAELAAPLDRASSCLMTSLLSSFVDPKRKAMIDESMAEIQAVGVLQERMAKTVEESVILREAGKF